MALMSGHGFAEEEKEKFDISAQPISSALIQFATQSKIRVAASADVSGLETNGISGVLTAEEALEKLLKDTGLVFYKNNNGDLIIKKQDSETEEAESENQPVDDSVDEEVVVTGSRIARNASEVAASIITLDSDSLKRSGESTLEGALRRLPQNMFGASEVAAAFRGSSFNGALNITGGSSINLRGLGSESTLVLVDGRRIGKSGVFGGASDITAIPLKSVERVEIMLDGASAIYGSDAVGGVVNIILKKDYDGVIANYEYGKPEDGGFEEHVFTVSGATAWDGGRLSVDFERFQRSNLDGNERQERLLGTANWRTGMVRSTSSDPLFYIYDDQRYLPSELPVANTDPGVQAIRWAVLPDTQTGSSVSLSDITLFTLDETLLDTSPDASEGISLIPAQERNNLQLRIEQALSENIDIGASLYYSDRSTYAGRGAFANTSTRLNVGEAGNIFESSRVNLSFRLPDLADQHQETGQTVTRWTVYVNGELGDSWQWEAAIGQSQDKTDSLYVNSFNNAAVSGAITDGLQLFTGDIVGDNSLELLSQLVAPPFSTESLNKESTFDFRTRGELFQLPGGAMSMATGVEWRQESLESRTETRVGNSAGMTGTNFSLPTGAYDTADLPAPVSDIQRSVFAEVLLPLVGADNALTAVQQLTLTGAARYDSYDNVGSDSTWSLGLVWSPIEQVRLKLRQSTSFVAPTPREKLIPANPIDLTPFSDGIPVPVVAPAGNTVGFEFLGILIFGGNPHLEPETARSSSATVEITPDLLPGLRLSASWHATEYGNRINSAPSIPQLPAGVDYVAENPFLSRGANGSLIQDRRTLNTALLYQSGMDYQLYYSRDTDMGEFYITANIAATSNYETMLFPGEPRVNVLERFESFHGNPVPAYRYSTDLGWNYQGLSATLTANTSSTTFLQRELGSETQVQITDAPWNVNLTLSYDVDGGDLLTAPEWLSGSTVSFRVLNLLNDYTRHSIVDVDTGMPVDNNFYTAGLADPRGRMLYVALTKQF